MDCSTPDFPVLQLSPRLCPNSCSLSQWCHPTILSSVTLFSFCLQSFPASESFPVSRLFSSGGQSFGASASASVLPMNIQGWFPLGLTCLISLMSKGLARVFSSTTVLSEWKSLGHVRLFTTPWALLSSTISWSLLKFMFIESVMLSNHLILCCPFFFLPSIFPSLTVFQWVDSSHQVAKVLELQFQC